MHLRLTLCTLSSSRFLWYLFRRKIKLIFADIFTNGPLFPPHWFKKIILRTWVQLVPFEHTSLSPKLQIREIIFCKLHRFHSTINQSPLSTKADGWSCIFWYNRYIKYVYSVNVWYWAPTSSRQPFGPAWLRPSRPCDPRNRTVLV